ncbi:MAG: hypothetical protein D6E12_07275 [Desulfovibrio sp.]|nr:MAG: hypothetical protein D6E12_07275 [Desulfovibrio sp.]
MKIDRDVDTISAGGEALDVEALERLILRMARTASALGKTREPGSEKSRTVKVSGKPSVLARIKEKNKALPGLYQGKAELELERSVGSRWWVLVCGDSLASDSIIFRDKARERLRKDLSNKGLRLSEYVWVWDETNQVQVVAGEFARRDQADEFARKLGRKGFRVRVVQEMEGR